MSIMSDYYEQICRFITSFLKRNNYQLALETVPLKRSSTRETCSLQENTITQFCLLYQGGLAIHSLVYMREMWGVEAVAEKDSITTALHKHLNKLPQMELWMMECDKVKEYFGDSWNSHF